MPYARKNRAEQLFQTHMKPWIKEQPYYKIHVQVDSRWFKKDFYERQGINVDDGGVKGVIAFPPMINKHAGTMSPYVDAIDKFERKHSMTSFHRHLELSLCVVFCNSAEIFRKILLNDWSSVVSPTGRYC